jgi:hypothetical protein
MRSGCEQRRSRRSDPVAGADAGVRHPSENADKPSNLYQLIKSLLNGLNVEFHCSWTRLPDLSRVRRLGPRAFQFGLVAGWDAQ